MLIQIGKGQRQSLGKAASGIEQSEGKITDCLVRIVSRTEEPLSLVSIDVKPLITSVVKTHLRARILHNFLHQNNSTNLRIYAAFYGSGIGSLNQ
ncbi:MAG: hypothetical protein ABJQ85_01350 [Rhizobiaceae bacterium]